MEGNEGKDGTKEGKGREGREWMGREEKGRKGKKERKVSVQLRSRFPLPKMKKGGARPGSNLNQSFQNKYA